MWRNVVAASLLLVACWSSARAEDSSAEKKSDRLGKIGRLVEEKRWGEAEGYLLAEIADLKARVGNRDNDLLLGVMMSVLAKVYNKNGRPDDAVVTLNSAVEIINRHDDLKDNDVRVHINWAYGEALHQRKEFELAQVYYERAMGYADKPRTNGINPNHLSTAMLLIDFVQNGMSLMDGYFEQGKSRQLMLGQAVKMEVALKRASVILEEKLGADHEDTQFVRRLAKRMDETREVLARKR